jgi:hypothetical protein
VPRHPRHLKQSPRPPISGLASCSLRSDAHVPTYAVLRSSRKPRQNTELGGRAVLKVAGGAKQRRASRGEGAQGRTIYLTRITARSINRTRFGSAWTVRSELP